MHSCVTTYSTRVKVHIFLKYKGGGSKYFEIYGLGARIKGGGVQNFRDSPNLKLTVRVELLINCIRQLGWSYTAG